MTAARGTMKEPVDPRLFESLEWRLIGPFRGGRVVAVAGHPTQVGTFYFGGCAGGVWKTTDGGSYWENISDGFFNTAAVGAMAVAESDPNVIYVGTGETAIRGNVSHGDGVYRSTDGGRTWQHLGLADTHAIGRIRVHPQNPDLVYVAALGHVWGTNAERGIYRSKDGGRTWEHILFKSDRAGAIDLTMDPHNPRVLYAAFWQAQRYPHALNSGGPDSALYRSTDGGDTWEEITRKPGLPSGTLGKIGVAASPAKAGRVWALIEAEDGAMFRSDDGGDTWTRQSEQGELRRRAWYYMHIVADPSDADTVWVMNLKFWKSIDGGKSFQAVPTPHGDNHDLWIDPRDSNRMIEGNDGGACVTYNGGLTWSSIYNQPTAQFYHVTTDNRVPYRVFGSQQDNTAMSVPSESARGAITQTEWWEPGGGESGYIAVKPDNPEVIFGGGVGSGAGDGRLIRFDHSTGETRIVTVWPEVTGMGRGAKHYKYRFQWTFPIHFSKHDANTLYTTSNHVHRSTDEGMSWEVASPDLTRNEPSKLEESGGPITLDNTGAELYCTIFALAESPHERGVFWAGSDDGLIHLTRDNMQSWQNVTPPADLLPEWALISIIEPSPHDAGTAYVAATRYKHDDFRPYILKTTDYGQSWTAITDGIPANEFTRTVREDPNRKGLLYAGTETGVYVSFDSGARWQRFQANLPVTPIHDLIVKGTDLIAATHGRSFWILDDVTPLHQLSASQADEPAHLYAPRPASRFKRYGRYGDAALPARSYGRFGGIVGTHYTVQPANREASNAFLDAGKNPPDGVIVHYYLKDKPQGEVTLTFLDARGNEVRTYSSQPKGKDTRVPAEAGANRFVWNMRYPDAHDVPGVDMMPDALAGPVALPGRYQVRLSVDGQSSTQPFEIRKDPRVAGSDADLAAQFELLSRLRDTISETHDAINHIRTVRDQVDGWATRADKAEVTEAAEALKEKLSAIERELIQPEAANPRAFPSGINDKLTALSGMIANSDTRPNRQSREVSDKLQGEVNQALNRLQDLFEVDLARFNQQLARIGVPAVVA